MITKLIRLAAALYPRAWRERYGEEFAATLNDMPAQGWGTVWDVGKGALIMQVQQDGLNLARKALPFVVVFMALAFPGSWAIPNQYMSHAVVATEGARNGLVALVAQPVLTRDRLKVLVLKHQLYLSDRTRKPMDAVIETMQRSIQVTALTGTKNGRRALRVGFLYADPAVA